MGGKTAQSTQAVTIPPAVLAQYQAVNSRATQTASTPFQNYNNEFVAPVNPQQQSGISGVNAGATEAQPYFDAATGTMVNTQAGTTGINNAATGLAAGSAQAVNPSNLDASSIDKYLSPYLGTVLGSESALLNQNNEEQQAGQLGTAITSGAFGGDRAGLAAANLEQQQNLSNASIYGNILNTGYEQALGTAQQQQGVGLAAGQANRAALGTAGSELASIGQTQYGEGATTATTLAGLGAGAQTAALTGAQAQIGAGTVEQQTQQAQDTALYNQFLQQQSYPFQVDQFLANIAEGTGALSGSTTTTQQPGGFFSDKRLKHDIKTIGKLYDGQYIVSYKMHGDSRTHIGLIAQDVEKKHPHAVGVASGYKIVDYGKATEEAANRGHFSSGGLAAGNDDEGYFSGAPAVSSETHIKRALDQHGVDYSHVNGVLHAHIPYVDRHGARGIDKVPIGNSVPKLKNALGYAQGGSVASGDSRVWRPGAYAVGGSSAIVDANDMRAILEAQQGMYAPMSGGASVYGSTGIVPRGGSARVPVPSGATPHLVTASGGLAPQRTPLENAKGIMDTGKSANDLYLAFRKDHPQQQQPAIPTAIAPASTPGDAPDLAHGGRAGYDDGGSAFDLGSVLDAQQRMYQPQHTNRQIPSQDTGSHQLAVASGSPAPPPSGSSNVNTTIGLGKDAYGVYKHFNKPPTSTGVSPADAAAEGPATDTAAAQAAQAGAAADAAPAASETAAGAGAADAAGAAGGAAAGSAAGAAGGAAVDAGATEAAAALAAEYAAADAAVAIAAAKRGGRIRHKFDAGGTPYEDSGGQLDIPDYQPGAHLQTAGPIKKQPTGLQTAMTMGNPNDVGGIIGGMFSNQALAHGGVAGGRRHMDTGGSPDDQDSDYTPPQGVVRGIINRDPQKQDLLYTRDAGSSIPRAAPLETNADMGGPNFGAREEPWSASEPSPNWVWKHPQTDAANTDMGGPNFGVRSGPWGDDRPAAATPQISTGIAGEPQGAPAPSPLPPKYTGGVGGIPVSSPDMATPAQVPVEKPSWWDKIKGSSLAKPENLIPLLTAIGAMGTAPTRSLGVALSSGLLAGAGSYLPTRQALADISQTGAQTGRIGASTQGQNIENLGALQRIGALQGFVPVEDPAGNWHTPDGKNYRLVSKGSLIGGGQSSAPTPPQYSYLGQNGMNTVKGEGIRYSTVPDDAKGSSQKQIDGIYEAGHGAQQNMLNIQRWEQSMAANKGVLDPGALNDLRVKAVNLWDTMADQIGHPEEKIGGLSDAQMSAKVSTGAAAMNENEHQQRSFGALKAFLQATPNPEMQKSAALPLIADLHTENQMAIDKKNYLDEFDHANQDNFGAPVPRNYLATDALQAFDRDYPATNYQGERNHLSNIIQSQGFAKFSSELQNASPEKKQKLYKAIDAKYGPNFHRYFTGS